MERRLTFPLLFRPMEDRVSSHNPNAFANVVVGEMGHTPRKLRAAHAGQSRWLSVWDLASGYDSASDMAQNSASGGVRVFPFWIEAIHGTLVPNEALRKYRKS